MQNRNRNRGSYSESYRNQQDLDRSPSRQQQDFDRSSYRQEKQFQRGMDDQYGESRYSSRSYQPGQGNRYSSNEGFADARYGDPSTGYSDQDYDPLGDYDRAASNFRSSRSGNQQPRQSHSYFRGDDYGGQDYTRSRYSGGGTRPSQMQGYGGSSDWSIPPRQYDRDDRGFFDRATDEVMSWFGDDDAASRRRRDANDHRGRGPSNYTKSDDRLLEDACERLTHDYGVDASNINVTVKDGEVTLDGTVDSRQAKRRAEDCVDDIHGVKHVQNNLRVAEANTSWNSNSSDNQQAPSRNSES